MSTTGKPQGKSDVKRSKGSCRRVDPSDLNQISQNCRRVEPSDLDQIRQNCRHVEPSDLDQIRQNSSGGFSNRTPDTDSVMHDAQPWAMNHTQGSKR